MQDLCVRQAEVSLSVRLRIMCGIDERRFAFERLSTGDVMSNGLVFVTVFSLL